MKKIIYALVLSLIVISGLVFSFSMFANGSINNENSKKQLAKPLSIAEMKTERKKWEASPDGINYKKWEDSPSGKKVLDSEAKIRKSIRNYTNMEAVITSLSLPPKSRLGFGVMVRINGDDYILNFGSEKPDNFLNFNNEFEQLHNLKVNDKIIIKSHSVSHAPKYLYPIISGDYVERDSKIIYKREPREDGC